jgi:uncharacterized BrkB/YihY/UPF0761 family membrane protein
MLFLFAALLPIIVLAGTVEPRIGLPTVHHGTAATASAYAAAAFPSRDDPLVATLGVLASLAANFLLLLTAYTSVTPGGVRFRSAWPGALLAACLAQLYLLIFPFYVRNVLHPDHFGTVAGFVLVILVFFFAYALFIVIGAEVVAYREGYGPALRSITSTLVEARTTPAPHDAALERATTPGTLLPAPQMDAPRPQPSGMR